MDVVRRLTDFLAAIEESVRDHTNEEKPRNYFIAQATFLSNESGVIAIALSTPTSYINPYIAYRWDSKDELLNTLGQSMLQRAEACGEDYAANLSSLSL